MQKMKAYVRTSAADMNVELAEVHVPEVDAGEVLVKVAAFGVGVHDRYFIPANVDFPYVIGTEAAGVIERVGGDVKEFEAGERVALTSVLRKKGGCWAEFAAVPEGDLMPVPDDLGLTEASAVPIAGKTALESIRALGLPSGSTLFVAGASGAIGTLVIQIAAQKGIRVIGSASEKNHDYMRSLGAEQAVDYSDPQRKEKILEWFPGGVDAALAIQRGTADDCIAVVKDGGRVVTVSGNEGTAERGIELFQFEHHEMKAELAGLMRDIAAGRIKLVLEHVYPFDEAIEALTKTETRHARGKLAVEVIRQVR